MTSTCPNIYSLYHKKFHLNGAGSSSKAWDVVSAFTFWQSRRWRWKNIGPGREQNHLSVRTIYAILKKKRNCGSSYINASWCFWLLRGGKCIGMIIINDFFKYVCVVMCGLFAWGLCSMVAFYRYAKRSLPIKGGLEFLLHRNIILNGWWQSLMSTSKESRRLCKMPSLQWSIFPSVWKMYTVLHVGESVYFVCDVLVKNRSIRISDFCLRPCLWQVDKNVNPV